MGGFTIDKTCSKDEAIKLMQERGYSHTATNKDESILYFLRNFPDQGIHLHATLFLDLQKVDLDSVGLLSLGVTLYCPSIELANKRFSNFEKTLFEYIYLCKHGKHCNNLPVFGPGDGGMVEQDGGESQTKSEPARGRVLGGVKKGEGKPEKPTVEARKKELWEKIRQVGKEKGYQKEMCVEFYDYWTEMNEGGKKMRFEMEKIFEISRRLSTWLQNDKKWSKNFLDKKFEKQEKQLTNKTNKNVKHKDLF